jgi:hypothetical protein
MLISMMTTLGRANSGYVGQAYPETEVSSFAVDHDHDRGLVRGLLCFRCNRLVGLANDDPDVLAHAANYLRDSERFIATYVDGSS